MNSATQLLTRAVIAASLLAGGFACLEALRAPGWLYGLGVVPFLLYLRSRFDGQLFSVHFICAFVVLSVAGTLTLDHWASEEMGHYGGAFVVVALPLLLWPRRLATGGPSVTGPNHSVEATADPPRRRA